MDAGVCVCVCGMFNESGEAIGRIIVSGIPLTAGRLKINCTA
jgi:hypothetical protein